MSGLNPVPEVFGIFSPKRHRDSASKEPGWRGREVRVPVRGERAPTLRVSRRAPELDAAPVEAVERSEIRPHVTRERADTPASKPAPIDLARKPFQSIAGSSTEHPPRISPLAQPSVELQLLPPSPLRSLARRNPQSLEPLERPWHEQEVARPSLDRASPGEEEIRKAVPNRSQPKLIKRTSLPKQVDHTKRTTPIPFRVVKPSQRRRHLARLFGLLP